MKRGGGKAEREARREKVSGRMGVAGKGERMKNLKTKVKMKKGRSR